MGRMPRKMEVYKVDLDIGSSLPLYKGDNNVKKEMGESSITKEALIKTNTSRNESGIFVPI